MKRILVVDDDPTCLNLVTEFVRNAGFEALTANDGAEGWDIFNKESIGVVITDYEMPKMNGLELLENIHRKSPEIPVVIFTGIKDTYLKKQAWDLGAFDFLFKPVDGEYIQQVVRSAYAFGLPEDLKDEPASRGPFKDSLQTSSEKNLFDNLINNLGVEVVREITNGFVKQSEQDLNSLKAQVAETKEAHNIARVAHRLKGSAVSLGLMDLAKACEHLESIGKEFNKNFIKLEEEIEKELESSVNSLYHKLNSGKSPT